MPEFSETNKVKELDEFNTNGGPAPPSQLKISHVSFTRTSSFVSNLQQISAHFLTFTAYSTGQDSIVLTGQNDASPTTKPTVIPALQNRGVISMVLGDYQFGALLENGQLLTWGQAGATGLGDPTSIEPGKPGGFRTEQERTRSLTSFQSIPDVLEPTEVRFDHELTKPRKRFAFAAAAAGWHMGALVVDLEEASKD
jgi:SCF-associated factor 1